MWAGKPSKQIRQRADLFGLLSTSQPADQLPERLSGWKSSRCVFEFVIVKSTVEVSDMASGLILNRFVIVMTVKSVAKSLASSSTRECRWGGRDGLAQGEKDWCHRAVPQENNFRPRDQAKGERSGPLWCPSVRAVFADMLPDILVLSRSPSVRRSSSTRSSARLCHGGVPQ